MKDTDLFAGVARHLEQEEAGVALRQEMVRWVVLVQNLKQNGAALSTARCDFSYTTRSQKQPAHRSPNANQTFRAIFVF